MPLPSLAVTLGVQSGQQLIGPSLPELPDETLVSSATEKSIFLLKRSIQPPPVKTRIPQVLPSDTTPMPDGELSRLLAIVASTFRSGDMASASRSLLDFLRLPRTALVAAHARYYLGQTYYFLGRPRDALMEFLISEDYFYPEAQPWLDACFEKLALVDK